MFEDVIYVKVDEGTVYLRDILGQTKKLPRCSIREVDVNNENWRPWLAVRDACPEGRRFRYDPEQIRYHYTKDLRRLRPDGLTRKRLR